MIESATGVILRTRPLTETSLIVHWLTPTAGRVATVAKGARRPLSPFLGKLDLFYEAEFSFQRSRRSELHTLREVSLRNTHATLRTDLGYVQAASYAAALIEQTTEMETPLPAIHELMIGFLEQLAPSPPQIRSVYAFELKLLNELGLKPDPDRSRLSDGAWRLLHTLSEGDWPAIHALRAGPAHVKELRQYMHGFLIYHLGKVPQGRSKLLT